MGIQSGIKTIRSKALSNTENLFRSSSRFNNLKKELEKSQKLLNGLKKPRIRPNSADICATNGKINNHYGHGN